MIEPRSARLLRSAAPLAGATVLAEIAYPLVRGSGRGSAALTVLTVVLFAMTSVTHAVLTRGRRAGVALLAVFGGGGLLAEAVGVATSVPFGRYAYTSSLGPRLFGVPAVVPLAWVMMAWPAYLVALRLTSGRGVVVPLGRLRVPLVRVLVAAWALASWDLFLDPQMVAAGRWRWTDPAPTLPGVPAVPLGNYLGWVVVATVLMAVLAAALAGTVPGDSGPADAGASPDVTAGWAVTRDAVPYGLYLWTYGSSVLAHVAFFGVPAAAGWGAAGMGIVAVPLAVSLSRPTAGLSRRHGVSPIRDSGS